MENELIDIKFKYVFREYQKEALKMLDKYINDEKIHIVAAPGAGKTILALELLIRIGKKALILAPTIAIKEQWVERLKKDFINGDKTNLISTDLEKPSIITITTYQALYALKRKSKNIEKIIQTNKIQTIIFDEAHHLRKVWFKVLLNISKNLKNCKFISLTATPPYDNGNDFTNYMNLCGNIDAKITIPQLVKNNCLCPHQDYIYFNIPSKIEEKEIIEYNKKIENFIIQLKNNSNFIRLLALNDFVVNTEDNIEEILENFDFYISIISFLKEVKCQIPINYFSKDMVIPNFNKEMLAVILQNLIFGKATLETEIFKKTIKEIKEILNVLGCIDEKNINLLYSKELKNKLIKNSGKLESINKIIETEKLVLKDKLKLAVVTDFVKEEFYNIDEEEINEVGVIPIFKKITAKNISKVCVITGNLIIIPIDLKERLLEIAQKEFSISTQDIQIEELGINFDYSKVILQEKYKRYSVSLITKLFEQTDINVIIGTVALIGEGWDAPFLNSIIMASFISSYVTSNQIRGRAIRIDKKNVNKVSNIWHLVCLETEGNYYKLGIDYNMISKRFLAYEGLSFKTNKIASGIDRLDIKDELYTEEDIKKLNNNMMIMVQNRTNVIKKWKTALQNYEPISKEILPLERVYRNKNGKIINKRRNIFNIQKIVLALVGWGIYLLCMFIPELIEIISFMIILFLFICLLLDSKINFNNLINSEYFSNVIDSEYNYVKKICTAIYLCMKEKKLINEKSKYLLTLEKNKIEISLKKTDIYEQNLFIKAVKQATDIDSNSRYIIKCGRRLYTVPEIFSKNKHDAKVFCSKINTINKELIYTKTEKGRKILLKYKISECKNSFCR